MGGGIGQGLRVSYIVLREDGVGRQHVINNRRSTPVQLTISGDLVKSGVQGVLNLPTVAYQLWQTSFRENDVIAEKAHIPVGTSITLMVPWRGLNYGRGIVGIAARSNWSLKNKLPRLGVLGYGSRQRRLAEVSRVLANSTECRPHLLMVVTLQVVLRDVRKSRHDRSMHCYGLDLVKVMTLPNHIGNDSWTKPACCQSHWIPLVILKISTTNKFDRPPRYNGGRQNPRLTKCPATSRLVEKEILPPLLISRRYEILG